MDSGSNMPAAASSWTVAKSGSAAGVGKTGWPRSLLRYRFGIGSPELEVVQKRSLCHAAGGTSADLWTSRGIPGVELVPSEMVVDCCSAGQPCSLSPCGRAAGAPPCQSAGLEPPRGTAPGLVSEQTRL